LPAAGAIVHFCPSSSSSQSWPFRSELPPNTTASHNRNSGSSSSRSSVCAWLCCSRLCCPDAAEQGEERPTKAERCHPPDQNDSRQGTSSTYEQHQEKGGGGGEESIQIIERENGSNFSGWPAKTFPRREFPTADKNGSKSVPNHIIESCRRAKRLFAKFAEAVQTFRCRLQNTSRFMFGQSNWPSFKVPQIFAG
jgi:hypothetical protein